MRLLTIITLSLIVASLAHAQIDAFSLRSKYGPVGRQNFMYPSCSLCPRISMVKTAEARRRFKPLATVPVERRSLRRRILI
jgi:hypothetical protein